MSTKLAWTRLNTEQWAVVVDYLPPVEGNIYMRLRFRMLRTGEPLVCNIKVLSHYTGYSVKRFEAALNVLLEGGYIIRLEDGSLWNLDVEEELKNCNETLNKLSEKAIKAANTKKNKHQDNSSRSHDDSSRSHDDSSRGHDDSSRGHDEVMMKHNNNNNNIYNKKTNTIVLVKKEIGSESLETDDQVHEPTEVHACESPPDQIATSSDNQPPIDEQENAPKKAKRVRSDRGCRLPEDFKPNLQYAIDKGLTHDEAMLAAERFANFWLAKSGKDATKKDATKDDWQRTWYNWVTHPELGPVAQKKAKLEQEKQYGKPRIERTGQQRGWNYRVAQHMSNVKNSDSVYKFLFEDNERTTIPLESGAKTIDCRSGEGYLIGP
ncbi:hypothetical protein MCQ_00929 [Candidatus Bartonella washoeensis Sb944nv]|uniref:Uncharacterized protein n=1 Tax=Candidatus Bartonella washoeensis Sb944nv TaxID=1094563 RepID=J0YVD7_9HYPH|nr:DUF1376 domain-containing protein [Bartonella washoeensis]EJF79043.1 hypothetical protein MCQ_00929 [Bartonella washoeensis Sb944nv]